MHKILLTILFSMFSVAAFSQARDSMYVVTKNEQWYVTHPVKKGETIFTVAQHYHVPPAALADVNGVNFQTPLKEKTKLYIPLAAYNHVSSKPSIGGTKNVYYRVHESDNLRQISRYAGVRQNILQSWNKMPDNSVEPGQVLFVGWVLYDTVEPSKRSQQVPRKISKQDSIKLGLLDTLSTEERLFLSQTDNGTNVIEEKGSAVFFAGGKIKGTNMYFGFHNTAPKGTVIKVYNPGSDKTIYVKVLSTIPETKQYHNTVIGIGGDARKALGALEDKVWCELKYAGE